MQKLHIGIVSSSINLDSRYNYKGFSCTNFVITPNHESVWHEIHDSFVSTPSRYLYEMLSRIKARYTPKWYLIFNPLIIHDKCVVELVVNRVLDDIQPGIFFSANKVPLAYLLSGEMGVDSRCLLLLSCSNLDLDHELINLIFSDTRANLQLIPVYQQISILNGFVGGGYQKPNEWCTRNAIKLLIEMGLEDRVDFLKTIKLVSYFSHHAGDVLFMARATVLASPIYSAIVIHKSYVSIFKELNKDMEVIEIDGPIPFRNGYNKEDCDHFLEIAQDLPLGRFYIYCRVSRNYNFTCTHLIDHFVFCLGNTVNSINAANQIPDFQLKKGDDIKKNKKKVMVHLDAGWPLKTPNVFYQEDLIKELCKRYEVVTLDSRYISNDARNLKFTSLSSLRAEIESCDLFIGMDSFPAHYAAWVMCKKTLHIFACTHPAHSNAGEGVNHAFLIKGETCVPCLGYDECPKYHNDYCANMPEVSQVVTVACDILIGKSRPVSDITRPRTTAIYSLKNKQKNIKIFRNKIDYMLHLWISHAIVFFSITSRIIRYVLLLYKEEGLWKVKQIGIFFFRRIFEKNIYR